jgi:NADPH:quinone reductase-like Zn-dependent oxidoreductase
MNGLTRSVIQIGDVDFGIAITSTPQTAAAALFAKSTLNIPIPLYPANPEPNGKKILIWGGASAMGALAICHAKAAGYTVISTSSPHNFPLLKERGADHVFDYNDEDATINSI